MLDEAAPDIGEVFGERVDCPSDPKAISPAFFLEDVELKCILEPICLDAFIFAECPHPGVSCLRHHFERLAEMEGERIYGPAEWRRVKEVDRVALAQMVEGVRGRERLEAP